MQLSIILHVIRMSLVSHSYVLVCHSYVIRMLLVCARMSPVCQSYVSRVYSYITRMSLVCGLTMNRNTRTRIEIF